MFFFRKLIGRFLFIWVLGWVMRKLRGHPNPKVKNVGDRANRVLGGAFGIDPSDPSLRGRPRRGMRRSASSAAVGGLMSYFFDPMHGGERRAKAKRFASERLAKARTSSGRTTASAPGYGVPDVQPIGAQSTSNIT